MRIKLALIVAAFILSHVFAINGICGTGTSKPEKKIIDMHAHIAGIGAGDSGCFISDAMKNSWKFRVYLKSFGVSEKEVKEKGDSIIVERFSVSGVKSLSLTNEPNVWNLRNYKDVQMQECQ